MVANGRLSGGCCVGKGPMFESALRLSRSRTGGQLSFNAKRVGVLEHGLKGVWLASLILQVFSL